MEHDRIATLLSSTPPGLPEAHADAGALLRRFRRRRVGRLIASSVAATVAALGLVVPLALLAGVGSHSSGHRPTGGSIATRPSPVPPTSGSGAGMPDVGRFTCTTDGVEVGTPEFAVQPDGPHLHVDNPASDASLVLTRTTPSGRFPVDLSSGGATDTVEAFLAPGNYLASCESTAGTEGDGARQATAGVPVRVANPDGIWVDPTLDCAATTRAAVLSAPDVTVATRDDVPAVIRTSVVGIEDADEISQAAYPESDQEITFLVRRGGTAVAVVRVLGRSLPISRPGLDVVACSESGIAAGQQVR
ncbi:MAG: hypothetical protein ACJ77A_06615 [Actinomycetota bacterium]